jgi:hypothetical protein
MSANALHDLAPFIFMLIMAFIGVIITFWNITLYLLWLSTNTPGILIMFITQRIFIKNLDAGQMWTFSILLNLILLFLFYYKAEWFIYISLSVILFFLLVLFQVIQLIAIFGFKANFEYLIIDINKSFFE